MKKFLDDTIKGPQKISFEILKELYPNFSNIPDELKQESNNWTLFLYGKTKDGLEWQVAYQNVNSPKNLVYHVYIFGKDGELAASLPVLAVQMIPPLQEKCMGIDYGDWLEIQGTIYKFCVQNKLKPFEIDINPEGKVIYQTKDAPEIAIEKMKRGESYEIVAIKAEVFLEKIKQWKEEKKANQSTIITPEQIAKEDGQNAKIVIP